MITREIVASYGGVRAMLEKRMQAQIEIEIAWKECMRGGTGAPAGYGEWPAIEKVPGMDVYVYAPRGTNNPQGAAMQREDFRLQNYDRLREQHAPLIDAANALIDCAEYGADRAILRYYYGCNLCDDEIANRMHYSRSNVNKRRWMALKELEMRFC